MMSIKMLLKAKLDVYSKKYNIKKNNNKIKKCLQQPRFVIWDSRNERN